jgi:peroxiredoxin
LRNDATKKFELLNKKAPLIKFTNLNGNPVSSSSFPGNLLIVNVWATWCKPCIKEMPGFKELLRKMNRPDVKLLAVSIDQKLYKVQDFVKENSFPFVFLHDPDANIRSIFDGVVPATYIINKKGELVARVEGSIEWDKKEIRAFLEYLANE